MRDRELSSPRLVQSASWQSASWRIRELSSYRGEVGEWLVGRQRVTNEETVWTALTAATQLTTR